MKLKDLKKDIEFIKGHRLQPAWFKIMKIFVLAGIITVYVLLLGPLKTIVWLIVFLGLAAIVHFSYRAGTRVFTRSWLDFQVVEKKTGREFKRIGPYYYIFVLTSFAIATVVAIAL
jgi:hypothetical protein